MAAKTKISLNPKSFSFESAILSTNECLKHFAKYIGVPVTFKNEKLIVDKSLGKRCLWFSSLTVLFLRAVLVTGALVLSLTVDRFFNPLHLPLCVNFAMGFGLLLHIGKFGLHNHVEEFVLIWNSILKYKTKVKPPKLQVWVLHLFPLSTYVMVLIMNIFLALHPDWMIQFRFGVTWAVAEGYLNERCWGYYVLVVICTLLDFWSLFSADGIAIVAICSHILFMETWPSVMKQLLRSSKKSTSRFAAILIWRQLQELLVMLQIFNVGNASIVFAIKFGVLFASIFFGSAMILIRFHDNFLLFVIMAYMSLVVPFVYPALYYNAYGISAGLRSAKSELLGVSKTKIGQALLERRLRSVPTKGVWVGSIRTFERESVLIFFDFLIRTIMSIVLASK